MNSWILVTVFVFAGIAYGQDESISETSSDYYFSEAMRSAGVLISKYKEEGEEKYAEVYSRTIAKYLFIKWKEKNGAIDDGVIADVVIAFSVSPALSELIKNPLDLHEMDFSTPESVRAGFEKNILEQYQKHFGYKEFNSYSQDVDKFKVWFRKFIESQKKPRTRAPVIWFGSSNKEQGHP